MPEKTTDPVTEVDPKWLLIMARLKVDDLAGWLRKFRTGNRASNPDWRSWEAIARKIWEETRVTVSANGLRARWSDEVDAGDLPTTIASREDAEKAGLAAAWDKARGSVAPVGSTSASDAVGPTGTEKRGDPT